MSTAVFYGVPGKVVVEPPKLVVRQVNGRDYYWNFAEQKWKRLTRRCPYIQ